MSDTVTGPSTSDYLNASYWAYAQAGTPYNDRDTTLPTGFSYFMVGGQPMITYQPDVGLYAAAVVNAAGQIIITYEGTNLYTGNDTFTAAQIADDVAIAEGVNAASYAPAASFAQSVIAAAETQGYSTSDIFLAGHSLGAAEAEYVATQTGLTGTTFGTPGLPTADLPANFAFTDYVERGDPVGNYAYGWNDFALLQTQNVQHLGDAIALGTYASAALLYSANITYAAALNAPTRVEEVAGLLTTVALLGEAAVKYHALLTYAADLGVTVSGAASNVTDLTGAESAFAQILGTTSGLTVSTSGGLDFTGVDLTAPGVVAASGSGLTLTLSSETAALPLLNPVMSLSLQSDGQGGTLLTFGAASDGVVLAGSDGAIVSGDAKPLTFVGGTGAVSVIGGSGAVTLYGATSSTATSFLMGGSGTSLIHGGAGASTLVGGSGASTLAGGSGPTLILANGAASQQIQAGAGATTVNGLYGTGPEAVFAGSGADIIALGAGADSVIAGSGAASIIGGTGSDVYGFIDGHAGSSVVITGLKASDSLVFGGYAGKPITSEGVLHGSDLITLSDGTVILLSGLDHKIFS